MTANWLYESNQVDDLIEQILTHERNWQEQFTLDQLLNQIQHYVAELSQVLSSEVTAQENFYRVVDAIFDELAFSGPGEQMLPESSLSNVSYAIMHRTGNHVSLSVVLRELLRRLGFNAFISEIESQVTLVVKPSNSELLILDPVTGASEYLISSDDVRETMANEIASFAKELDAEAVVKDVLTEQKIALLGEGLFEEALKCVETLMDLLPEDPYERRDRGLVLQQLDCGHWAKDDFDYFIKACPNDPMAVFIKSQLEDSLQSTQTIH